MNKLSRYNLEGNVLLSPKKRIRLWIEHKRTDMYVQRVESVLYKRMGWDGMHYLDQGGATFNESHFSLIFTDSKDRCIAFVGYANHTFRRCTNGIMISRIVVAPRFQHKGLSVIILNLVGAMLSASGYKLYFNTELPWFGKKVGKSNCWIGTAMDRKYRKAPCDARNKHRRSGVAWRKKYVGKALRGYSDLFLKDDVLRSRMAKTKASECDKETLWGYSDVSLDADVSNSMRVNIMTSRAILRTGADGIYIIVDDLTDVIGYEDSS